MLGSLSEKYEVGKRGIGTVSTGIGDAGGISYGSYQMTSKPNGGTVKRFVSQDDFPFKREFEGLIPGSEQFTRVWKALAQTEPIKFKELQHEFIKRTHYDKLANKILDELQLDVNRYSLALQNVIWSVAVQHGGNTSMVTNAIKTPTDFRIIIPHKELEKVLIQLIYKERSKRNADGNLAYFSRNSKEVQKGVANRFINEEKDALNMLDKEYGKL